MLVHLLFFLFLIAAFIIGYLICGKEHALDISSIFDISFIFAGMSILIGLNGGAAFVLILIGFILLAFDLGLFIHYFKLVLNEKSEEDNLDK